MWWLLFFYWAIGIYGGGAHDGGKSGWLVAAATQRRLWWYREMRNGRAKGPARDAVQCLVRTNNIFLGRYRSERTYTRPPKPTIQPPRLKCQAGLCALYCYWCLRTWSLWYGS